MKKTIKNILLCSALALTLGSCSKVSSDYASKINKAYETEKKDDDYTYERVVKDLGKNWILNACAEGDALGGLISVKPTGLITWAADCKSLDDYNQKVKDGKKVKTIVVTFLAGIATHAEYQVVDYSTSSAK